MFQDLMTNAALLVGLSSLYGLLGQFREKLWFFVINCGKERLVNNLLISYFILVWQRFPHTIELK